MILNSLKFLKRSWKIPVNFGPFCVNVRNLETVFLLKIEIFQGYAVLKGFAKHFKNIFFAEHLMVTASELRMYLTLFLKEN